MNNRIKFLPVLLLAAMGPHARAQTTPVLTATITEVDVSDGTLQTSGTVTSGGTNYNAVPTVTLNGGGGSGAVATASISGGAVTGLTVTPGSGYIGDPTVTFSGGSNATQTTPAAGAAATVSLNFPAATRFVAPFQNEVSGPAGLTLALLALASGTQPLAGFTYAFTVNGQSIGHSIIEPPGTPGGGLFTPPVPGVYYISATTTDGNGNTATTLPVRYFAIGTAITSPVPGTLVPLGSSVVISATSTPVAGFIQRIDFYTDWTGTPATSKLIGTSATFPYSVIYSPVGASGVTHIIHALAYDNNGNPVPASTSMDTEPIKMVTPIGPLPTCVITTPQNNSSIPIPDYTADPNASIPVSVSASARVQGTIAQVQLYIDGVLSGTISTFPYQFKWSPKVVGIYNLTALAYDDKNNVVASTTSTGSTQSPAPTIVSIGALPSVAITTPSGGGTLTGGGTAVVQASASANSFDPSTNAVAVIKSVQFFQDGRFVGKAIIPTFGTNTYAVSFTAVQKIDPASGNPVPSAMTALATDSLGFTATSPAVIVNVTSGGSGGSVVGTPPTVTLTAPTTNANVVVNTPVTLSATANAPNGNIASIAFLVDNVLLQSISKYPYSVTWTPQNLGFYTLTATVTDNLGDQVTSTSATVNVVPQPAPTVSILSPTAGGTITVGNAITVNASASSPAGTISSVQFFANGLPIGTSSTPPYTISWTPTAGGVFTLTAVATDNSGDTSTSTAAIVEAVPAASGLGTTAYFGQYQGLSDGGRFAFIVVDGAHGTYIGHSTVGVTPVSTVFYSDIPISSGGSFSTAKLTGNASVAGVNGSLSPSQDLFIGAASQTGGVKVASGYYTGNLSGQAGSQVTGIVGGQGELMVFISTGSTSDVADGSVDSSGSFTITTVGNNTFTGKVDPATGFMTGTLSGPAGGSVIAAKVSGGTFSDGALKNISTRALVGTGANVMIAGFAVGGSASKQLLIRAAGPTLTSFNLPGAVSATALQVFSGATLVASNTGWSSTTANATAITAADTQVGAFAFPSGSADSALVGTFAPGTYTAQVTGVNGATGTALVEVYDLDGYTPFSSKKLVNVSTRGNVGTGADVVIGGFSINGTAPKRLLIRGAGPALAALNVAGSLPTPHLQLFNNSQTLIRENYSWEKGNDPALVSAASQATGAFAFAAGSADSAILIVLPPGTYTAALSGARSSTGIALIEVYELP